MIFPLKKNKLSKYIKDSLNKAHELAIKEKIKVLSIAQ